MNPAVPQPSVADHIAAVQAKIADAIRAAGRGPGDVQLCAVSKKQPLERLQAAYGAGLRDFGENYVQPMEDRRGQLPDDVRWHFIGHLQSNKARRVAWCHLIHSLDSAKAARLAAHAAVEAEHELRALVQVNISAEDSKSGLLPDKVAPFLDELRDIEGLSIEGLMCIPAPSEAPRAAFGRLRELRDALRSSSGLALSELSMGMSDSYEDAIAEGATIVRVGTALFGPRAT